MRYSEVAQLMRVAEQGFDHALSGLPWWARWVYVPGIRLAQACLQATAEKADERGDGDL